MALVAKLLHPDARLPHMGGLSICEDVVVEPNDVAAGVRTGVSVRVPHGMVAAVKAGDVCFHKAVRSGEEIVVDLVNRLSKPIRIRKGDHVADLVFRFERAVAESDASEMGPLA